jgi:hypothetical protein
MKGRVVLFAAVLLLLAGLASCAGGGTERTVDRPQSPLKAWIGMSPDQLKTLYPDIAVSADSKDRYTRRATEYGLQGEWLYSFTNSQLNWFVFNASETVIDKPNFSACLAATTDIIDSYRQILGQPQNLRVGIDTFNDPEIKPHNGYLVEQATWESPVGRIRVDFSFLGENKAYEFLVTLQVSK